ncbi:MAG: DUF3048 domain-containing protein [Actinobacteria bacterium]|nr:DUF3048 domain-containing protein [Actinomycetota bacterium]
MSPSRFRAAAVLVAASLVLAACGGDEEPAPAPSPSPSPSPTQTTTAALTGEPTTDEEVLERPALAVKVENSPAARPQAGLAEADIVFEELVEGGITRFMALYNSTLPDAVGPIRSGRFVDAEVLPPFQAILGLSGAAPVVVEAIERAGITTVYDDGDGDPFYRESGRRAPHNLFADPADLIDAAADEVPPASPAFAYDTDLPEGAEGCPALPSPRRGPTSAPRSPAPAPAESPSCPGAGDAITIRMSGASVTGWEFDERTRTYIRSQNGEPFEDAGGDLIAADNVVVLGMRVGPGGGADPAGNPLTDTQVLGKGRGVVLRDGHWYAIRWEKADALSHFRLLDRSGRDFPLTPGRTWLHLAPAEALPEAPATTP